MESDNIKASVQERFERAKQEQERIKEEKIRQLKTLYINTNNSNDQEHGTQRQAAVQSLQEKRERRQSDVDNIKAERLKQFLGSDKVNQRGSVTGIWDNSVNASKSVAQQQYNNLREQTMTGFRAADAGFVKKRAGEFERIYMAKMASESAILAAIRAGKLVSSKRERDNKERKATPKSANTKSRNSPSLDINKNSNVVPFGNLDVSSNIGTNDNDNNNNNNNNNNNSISNDSIDDNIREFDTEQTNADTFYDGSTHIYELGSIAVSLQTIFENVLKANTTNQHALLPCGIYSDSEQPPLDIVAVCMKAVNDDGYDSSYISVTINVCDGCENQRNAYGVFKIAVFPPDSSENAFERYIDFQPKDGWESWEQQYANVSNDNNDSNVLQNNSLIDGVNTLDINPEIIVNDNINGDDNEDRGEGEKGGEEGGEEGEGRGEEEGEEGGEEEEEGLTENVKVEPEEDTGLDLDFFTPGEDEPIFNFGRSLCITSGSCMPKYFGPGDENDPTYSNTWTIADETTMNLPDSIKDKVKLNVRSIIAISSSPNCLAIQTTNGSMIITGTLKSATSNSQILVRDNTIFEWIRGAAMSGILYKWPIKSKGNFKSRLAAKFFVLRDNEVAYHTKRPTSDHLGSSSKSFTLTANSTISTGRHLLLPCLTITTPKDTLWLRTGKNADITQKWIREVRTGINFCNRKKLFYSKERIESFWHHEADNFNSVCVDGIVIERGKYMHVALFLLDSSKSQGKRPEHHTDVHVPYIHSIDLSLTGTDRQQYELYSDNNMNAVMSTDIGTKLTCIKLLNNLFVFGGDRGYIGIGRIRDFRQGAVVYCTSPSVPFSMSDGDSFGSPAKDYTTTSFYKEFIVRKGHAPDATIQCLDVIQDAGIFAGGDDNGIITLWTLDNKIHNITAGGRMILQAVLNVSTLGQQLDRRERIRSLQFLPEEMSLLVTTNERLLYVTLEQNSNNDGYGDYYFDKWVELDSVLPDCQAYFTLCFDHNNNGKRSIILWKIVGEPYFGPGSTPLPAKAEDAIIFRLKYDDLFAHFMTKLQKI